MYFTYLMNLSIHFTFDKTSLIDAMKTSHRIFPEQDLTIQWPINASIPNEPTIYSSIKLFAALLWQGRQLLSAFQWWWYISSIMPDNCWWQLWLINSQLDACLSGDQVRAFFASACFSRSCRRMDQFLIYLWISVELTGHKMLSCQH